MSAVPAPRPYVQTRPSLRVVTRTRADVARALASKAAMFVCVALVTSAASGLTGHVMVEKARREGIRAAVRAREARTAEALLRSRVSDLTSMGSVQAWALAHGFQAPDMVAQPAADRRRLVAFNR